MMRWIVALTIVGLSLFFISSHFSENTKINENYLKFYDYNISKMWVDIPGIYDYDECRMICHNISVKYNCDHSLGNLIDIGCNCELMRCII